MEFAIYQLTTDSFISATVKLLEKIYNSGKRCVFFSPISERVDVINQRLWTFSTNAFIPHGDKLAGFEDQQPIYFTDVFKNPNNATILVLTDTFDISNETYREFERIMLIFDNPSDTEEAQKLYLALKNGGKNVNYWKQSSHGWEKLS